MRIELLQSSLPITENPGLDSKDPRFDEIATLVQAGNYAEAAILSENTFLEGIYDIRIICYFLYGHWIEQGMASMEDVINTLSYLIRDNWMAISSAHKREKNTQTSLTWMFRLLFKKVQYEEKKKTSVWQHWLTSVNTEDVEKMLLACKSFRMVINNQLGESAETVLESWSKIESWLLAFRQLVIDSPVLIQAEPEPEQNESDAQATNHEVNSVVSQPTFAVDHLNMELSYHMTLLLKKLAAFEHLLQEQKFPRAALLADDINQTLASFDPRLYFPKTLEAFFRLQALNFEELSAYESHLGSPQWQAMQEWLKIDLDSFVNN